jgi:hypothetical protein
MLSCSDNNSIDYNDNNLVEAQIIWGGELSGCGCEWIIFIEGENKWYKPSNLSEEYEVDELRVKLKYEFDNDFIFYCGDYPEPQPAIKIIKIAKM